MQLVFVLPNCTVKRRKLQNIADEDDNETPLKQQQPKATMATAPLNNHICRLGRSLCRTLFLTSSPALRSSPHVTFRRRISFSSFPRRFSASSTSRGTRTALIWRQILLLETEIVYLLGALQRWNMNWDWMRSMM